MPNRYKLNVVNISPSQYLKFNDEYQIKVNKILTANQNLDEDSQKYYNIIQKFPRTSFDYNRLNSVIRLKKNILGMLMVAVRIRNNEMKFLIDTGAEVTVLTDEALSSVGIKYDENDRIKVGSSNNKKEEMEIALLDKIEIGSISFLNLPVLVIPGEKLSFSILNIKLFKVDGVLGWDVLSQLDLELDYNKLEMKAIEFNENSYKPNLIKSNFPAILVLDENDQIITFGLDTGARKSWLSNNHIDSTSLKIIKQKKLKRVGAHGTEEEIVNVIKEYKIKLGDKQLVFNSINTGFTGFLNNFEFDGVFGIDIFKNNTIKIINSKGIILIE